MTLSPLHNLVTRHICVCRPVISSTASRFLSTTSLRHAQATNPIPTYGSAELLRRRYQPRPDTESERADKARAVKRMKLSAYGIAACTVAIFATIYAYPDPRIQQNKERQVQKDGVISLDGPSSIPEAPGVAHSETIEQVPTGTSTIPTFPKFIRLQPHEVDPAAPAGISDIAAAVDGPTSEIEYQLVGLGIRTVSIFGIQVYVVGLYVAVPDIAILQERLIRSVDPIATTLVSTEADKLKSILLDPTRGEEVWNKMLSDGGIRMAFRIVPTRNTDFMHMRDGFVRGVTARSTHFAKDLSDNSFADESFGQSLNDLKAVFGGGARKKIPYGETLLLLRDAKGVMSVVYQDKNNTNLRMGDINDERVSRLLWLNYLAGASVSSEPARQNIVDGCIEFAQRPVGTVALQVL